MQEKDNIGSILVTQNLISGKWKIILLWSLKDKKLRFTELHKMVPFISKSILTRQLKELEDAKLITREVYKEVPPRVEYGLTKMGESILPILGEFEKWGNEYIDENISEGRSRDNYMKEILSRYTK